MEAAIPTGVQTPHLDWCSDHGLPAYVALFFSRYAAAHAFIEWSGINALLYYGPTLVESIGFKGDTVTLAVSGGIGIVQFLAVLPAILIIDRVGTSCHMTSSESHLTFYRSSSAP